MARMLETPQDQAAIDPAHFRQTLGRYPTGICAVTATSDTGEPLAMIVGSFTSVSLAPPLVGFFPDRASSSWAKLRGCTLFGINVLAAGQQALCRQLASKAPDKFSGVPHHRSPNGVPRIEAALAFIECHLHSITEAGDHDFVLGRVLDMSSTAEDPPLLFWGGTYGQFTPLAD
jgi:3-hydroxy-9,10-secoandrosta-1,3,5(10)-triene-9,17-dione monooxygenase reductase component